MHESSHLSAGTLAVTVQRESAKTRKIRQKIVLAPVLSNIMHHLLLLMLLNIILAHVCMTDRTKLHASTQYSHIFILVLMHIEL